MDPNQPQPTPPPVNSQPEPAATPTAQQPAFAPASNPTPVAPKQATENPGKTLGIVSMILSIVGIGLIGLILGIVAKKKSKKAGFGNGFALAGIIVGIVNIILGLTVGGLFVAGFMSGVQNAQKCKELGEGTHVVDGRTYNCGTSSEQNLFNSSATNEQLRMGNDDF